MNPVRVQRTRKKGGGIPDGAVYVGRPSQWGNPFTTDQFTRGVVKPSHPEARRRAAEAFRQEIVKFNGGLVGFNAVWIQKHLRGKNLACWCPLEDKDGQPVPCHADVLLEIANA